MVFTTTDRIKRKGVTGGRPAEEIDSAGATVRTWLALIPSASSTVEQTDAVAAGLSGSQVREGLGEPGGVVHLEHDVRGSLGRIGGGSVNLGRGDFPRRRRRAPPRRRRNRRAATTRPGADSRAAPRGASARAASVVLERLADRGPRGRVCESTTTATGRPRGRPPSWRRTGRRRSARRPRRAGCRESATTEQRKPGAPQDAPRLETRRSRAAD